MRRSHLKLIIIATTVITVAACANGSTPQVPPTPAEEYNVAEPSLSPATSADSALESLTVEMDLDSFFEASFHELALRDPEFLLKLGLEEEYGIEDARLTDISDAYVRETQRLQTDILERLREFDQSTLTWEQQISYDVYEWYLDDQVRRHEFMYHNYPVNQLIFSADQVLSRLFEIHPLASAQDGQDYVARLRLVDEKFEQLIEGLELRETTGVVPPRFIVSWALGNVSSVAHSTPTATRYYINLEERLEGVSSTERQSVLEEAEEAITDSVLPAYLALESCLQRLESIAPTDDGVWQFDNGDRYYDYLLRHYTTTDLTSGEIHEMGMRELERVHAEMRVAFNDLGYPEDASLAQLFTWAARDGGFVPGDQVLETYEDIIAHAEQNLSDSFNIRPEQDVIVVSDPVGGFYMPGSTDGSRPGAFHANVRGGRAWLNMPTLAYHETVPGHHHQIGIARELDLPSFRNHMSFTGYAEGWALYAERLAWELGWYADDPYGNLGRLQYEAFRAARLVVDTGIHAKRWTYDQAVDFFIDNTGFGRGAAEYQIARYIAMPGQSTAYMVGMLRLLELREMAMDELGDSFDLIDFHYVVLSNGSMPLDVLDEVIEQYIEDRASGQ